MNATRTLAELDDLIQSRSILDHPFYVAWQRGLLSREQLATYARVYYPHVAAFPTYLGEAIAQTSDPVVRSELQGNLADELANPAAHHELWLDFAAELGLDRSAVAAAAAHPAAQNMVATFRRLSGSSAAGALSALYAYEAQQPQVSSEKMSGLREHYGLSSAKALAYFEVHGEIDIEHRAGERAALERCLGQGASAAEVLTAASEALDAYWKLLDGICAEAGVPVAC